MIDFPNSPTNGQVFSAPNGVVYVWSTTYSSWLAQNPTPPIGGTGEVTAISVASTNLIATDTVIPFATVQSGNAGLWWNTTTNRYTPPAGKYFINANIFFTTAAGGNATATFAIRKNGTVIGTPLNSSMPASFYGAGSVGQYVDANGTDFFDVVAHLGSGSITTTCNGGNFSAFPLTGVKGPAGPAGSPVVGDFFAVNNAPALPLTTLAVLIFPTIVTGNSGAYYNSTTGRYTPPAGRYLFFANLSVNYSGSSAGLNFRLRKNGVVVATGDSTSSSAGWWMTTAINVILDANGTDYFDIVASAGVAFTGQYASFGATPTAGMIGPPGPAGPPGSGPANADFFATYANYAMFTTATTVVLPTVVTGNAGVYYSTSTGRFTPPAGRYYIFASAVAALGSGALQFYLNLRKNGATVAYSTETPATSGYYSTAKVAGIFDANGTDYFDIQLYGNTAGGLATQIYFGATPTQGMPGPQGPPGPAGNATSGDFMATSNTLTGWISGSTNTILFPTIATGNAGSWYNPATGRWTPPAGRYFIAAGINVTSSAAPISTILSLRKNGVVLTQAAASGYTATAYAQPTVSGIFDANGTDWFDVQEFTNTSATQTTINWFYATPTTGLVGAQGPPGVISNGFRLINRIVPTAGQTTVDFTGIPSDINDLQINFDVTPTVNDVDLVLQFYDASSVLVTAGYLWSTALTWNTAAVATPTQQSTSTSYAFATGIIMDYAGTGGRVSSAAGNSIAGTAFIRNIRDTTRTKQANFNSSYTAGNGAYISGIVGNGSRNAAGAISGLRLSWTGTSNFAAGGAISLWGSP